MAFQRASNTSVRRSHTERAYKRDTAAPIKFAESPEIAGGAFQDGYVCLYGKPKIGKSTLASYLPGAYFLSTEKGLKFLRVRQTFLSSWEDFKAFVLWAEKHTIETRDVKMWVIDTATILAKHCMYGVCADLGISHPSDEDYGKGWEAFADEFTGWVLRLCALGKGMMFVCHESVQEITSRCVKINHYGPDLPRTAYRTIMPMCDIVLHMAYVEDGEASELGRLRCLYSQPSETRDAGDRSHRLSTELKFAKESAAVKRILLAYTDRKETKSDD